MCPNGDCSHRRFSGYRPEKFPFSFEKECAEYQALLRCLHQALAQAHRDGYSTFLCGMAKGFDLLAGEAVLEIRNNQPKMAGIKLIAVLPFEGHGFTGQWRDRHQMILSRANEVTTLAPSYRPGIYFQRNRYMVDHSSRLICYFDGKPGGTAHTVSYARKNNLDIINLADSLSTQRE